MGWPTCVWLLAVVQLSCAGYLLPGDVTPAHYDVRLLYDIDPHTNFSFFGVVDILLTAKKNTPKIILHAQDFEITGDKITVTGVGGPVTVTEVKLNDTYNFLTIALEKELEKNANYTLTIPFFGNLVKGLDGAYVSSYINKKNQQTEYLVTTQFEAISARKAFPCFDEPMYKATFTLNVAHNKQYTAISNMPLAASSDENSLEEHWPWETIAKSVKKEKSAFVWDQFKQSVPMSTYLVAYVVSKFSYVESPQELSHTKFKIWARSDAIDQTAYAAQVGPKVLSYFEKWFNVSFPLPKQDMIAIPDFAAGAMENWGLITYRETALLYDKKESSFLNKERIAEVVAHELAHQWFGNLVTMKWWSDLWLNEGFATFAASVGVNAVEPSWRARLNYAIENTLSILSLDALESSHPVSVPLDDPKRISEIFDTISYRKGATVIRMMLMFLGEDVFRKALHNYLTKYSYSNAEQDDLWAELTEVNRQHGGLSRNVTVKEVMDTWTKQTGYPLLNVNRDYSDKSVTITQKRYLSLGTTRSASSWWVPLSVLCEREVGQPKQQVQWLADNEGVTQDHKFEHGSGPNEWVLFNYDMIAPYRVNYDEQNWKLLVSTLTSEKFTNIPVEGRVQLLSDAFALAWNNRLDYGTTLKLASYLQRETEYLPLYTGLSALSKIENVIKRSADYGAYQKFMRRLITKAYERSGGLFQKRIINGEDLDSVKMQTTTSAWACSMKVADCEENAMEMYQRWMETDNPDENNPIPVDLRRTVYCVALRRGSVREWRFALARRRNSNVAAARDHLLYALACSRDVWILSQYLDWSVTDGSEIRRQDSGSVIAAVTRSTIGYYIAKDFIYNRIEEIYDAFKGQDRRIGFIIKTLLGQFTTQKELDEFLAWQEKNTKYLSGSKIAVSQGIENARVNIDWVNKNQQLVVDKLREFSVSHHLEQPSWASWRKKPLFMSSLYAIHNISSTNLKKLYE
ncbi:aminopeptidase N-like isoform X1 [Maniola hyperantus]|uniref:aminopeptidase N-like isoform X1 n=2 Tax=Aphantopus hyperantus TaxID=2795564 RepID=UPI001569967D|nr:aminopeptidase N-like isoform X1 [Maniola hyperantus]